MLCSSRRIAVFGGQRRHAAFAEFVAALLRCPPSRYRDCIFFEGKNFGIPRSPCDSTLRANRGTADWSARSSRNLFAGCVVSPGPASRSCPANGREQHEAIQGIRKQTYADSSTHGLPGTSRRERCSLVHGCIQNVVQHSGGHEKHHKTADTPAQLFDFARINRRIAKRRLVITVTGRRVARKIIENSSSFGFGAAA